jgi:hypothetical protein
VAAIAARLFCFSSAASESTVQSPGERPAAGDPHDIWQLNLKNGIAADYKLQFTRIVTDAKGQQSLEADTRNDKGEWHSCVTLPQGLLKSGQDYVVTVDYQVIERSGDGCFFYVFARSASLGYGADQWRKWGGQPGSRGEAKLRISASVGDFRINAGIHNQGAIRISGLRVTHGSGWTELPLEKASGASQPPAPPTGAQPFTVDAPSNPTGLVLNLADFGAVADGNSPPVPGPDRNLAAFKAAIARCREVKASKLIVPRGVYRITSGETIAFQGLSDFIFDGGGSTFLFHQIKGGAGIGIAKTNRAVFCNFNLDWDWKIDPLASVGRVTAVGPTSSFFEMRFEGSAPLDPKRWVTMNPLDEKLRAPGTGQEIGGFTPTKVESLGAQTVRVWPSRPVTPKVGQLYLLRHYTYEKHAIVMNSNTHLSLQGVTIFSFPGIGFVVGGDQHHFELVRCRITYPENERRPITVTADGFHVEQSQGFIRLEECDFGYMGDDCINIHDNVHSGVRRMDDHTLVVEKIVPWRCPFAAGDSVEIRNGDFSPSGFTGNVKEAKADYQHNETTLVFIQALPARIDSDAILFNHRYGSHNFIIRNSYFHENRARAILANTADGLIEGNRFFHNQYSALHLLADVSVGLWSEGFGARNIIVRHNHFEAANPAGAAGGAAVWVGAAIGGSPTNYPLLENLLLEDNSFKEMTGPVIEASSFKNLVLRGNSIVNLEPGPIALKMRGAIRAELGSGFWAEGNEWTTQKDMDRPGLFYDPDTTSGVVCRGNHLTIAGIGKR